MMKAFGCKTGSDVWDVDFTSTLNFKSGVGVFGLGTVVFILNDFHRIKVLQSGVYFVFI